ncbi:putative ribonuclease H-like domain-containing protein [Tanacetum coccineum]
MKTGLRPLNTARPVNTDHLKITVYNARPMSHFSKSAQSTGHPQKEDQGYVDSGCSRHMTGNMSYLLDFKEEELLVKELLKLMCDKKNSVLFTDTGCFVLSPDFKLANESQVLLKVPRKNNMYSVDMKNIVPKECLTCLVAKATLDESMLWHRRLGHVNFKTINKLVKENLVRGLPLKRFENDQTCVACLKGKQHKASSSKDETSAILKNFISKIENVVDKKVKIIRCDNGTEFKNRVMSEVCKQKGIKREFSVARTPQQNGVAERRNRTLIKVARTMLADSKLPTTFWVEAVNTACYVQNRVLVVKPHNKTCKETGSSQDCILMPLWKDGLLFDSSLKNASNDELQPYSDAEKKDDEGVYNATLEATHADFFGGETKVDMSNITTAYPVLSTLNTRIHKDHSLDHVIGDVQSGVLTRRMTKTTNKQGFISVVYEGKTHEYILTCLFSCFLSQEEPKKVIQALKDLSWIEAMQEELLQFKLQQVWTLVDLPHGKRAIGTKWVYRNKKDERVARIEAIRLFLDYASFKDFVVYQMDVKSAFLYRKIEEEVYVCQPLGFEDPEFPDRVYKVEKALYGLHQAPRAWPDIMFVVCACARFQVTPKVSHLHAVKRIFRYLKGQPKLGLWYLKDSPFDLETYSDSDYVGASLDRKSTTGGCQFLGSRLISLQCKKQTVVANSTTEAEYVAAASCCGQVLWIQNQMLDYGYNFKNTKIFINNESTICIVKNPVFHSKTKHIEIRHHFIKNSNENKLI